MKYKVGDKVRVRKDLETYRMYGKYEFEDFMELYKGKEATVIGVYKDNYDLDIDNDGFFWTDEMLEPIAENNADSVENTVDLVDNTVETTKKFRKQNLKFGDLVVTREGIKGIVAGKEIEFEDGTFIFMSGYNYNLKDSRGFDRNDIMKVERYVKKQTLDKDYTLQTMYKRKEEILDKEEKEYLSAVTKPFKNRKFTISKIQTYDKKSEFIFMEFSEDEYMAFPYFKKDSMYKGMEIRKQYTLKELGL